MVVTSRPSMFKSIPPPHGSKKKSIFFILLHFHQYALSDRLIRENRQNHSMRNEGVDHEGSKNKKHLYFQFELFVPSW